MKLRTYLNEEEQMDMKVIHNKIMDFFKKNPNPPDDKVHDLAESLGIDPDEFEEHIYMILTDLLKKNEGMKPNDEFEDQLKGGKADKKNPSDFDQKELKMGIEVELEHVNSREKAKEIAMDHLEEIPDYYTRLKKMEKGAGVEH